MEKPPSPEPNKEKLLPEVSKETLQLMLREFQRPGTDPIESMGRYINEMNLENPNLARFVASMVASVSEEESGLVSKVALGVYRSLRLQAEADKMKGEISR